VLSLDSEAATADNGVIHQVWQVLQDVGTRSGGDQAADPNGGGGSTQDRGQFCLVCSGQFRNGIEAARVSVNVLLTTDLKAGLQFRTA
jgi:hypothetical protein